MKRFLVLIGLLVVLATGCGPKPLNPELEPYQPQITTVDALAKLALSYKVTTEWLARACVVGAFTKEECDEIGAQVNQARDYLMQAVQVTREIVLLADDPMRSPLCAATYLACGDDSICRKQALETCYRRYISRYQMLLENAQVILRHLERKLAEANQRKNQNSEGNK